MTLCPNLTAKASSKEGGLHKTYREITHLANHKCRTLFILQRTTHTQGWTSGAWVILVLGANIGEMSLAMIPYKNMTLEPNSTLRANFLWCDLCPRHILHVGHPN